MDKTTLQENSTAKVLNDLPILFQEYLMNNGYHVIEILGKGGSGIISKVFNKELQKFEVIKYIGLSTNILDLSNRVQTSYNREIYILNNLKPLNGIVQFIKIIGVPNWLAYSMEYVDGVDFNNHIANRNLDTNAILLLAIKILSALQTIHDSGILHRDIKPQNIIIPNQLVDPTLAANPIIIDFGLSTIVDGDGKHAKLRSVVGTPDYIAYELLLGKDFDGFPNAAVDVYSVGVMLYFSLSGRYPYRDGDVYDPHKVYQRHLDTLIYPPYLHKICKNVGVDLSYVIQHALAKEPTARYQTANDLVKDLEAVIAGRKPSATPNVATLHIRKYIGSLRSLEYYQGSIGVIYFAAFYGFFHNAIQYYMGGREYEFNVRLVFTFLLIPFVAYIFNRGWKSLTSNMAGRIAFWTIFYATISQVFVTFTANYFLQDLIYHADGTAWPFGCICNALVCCFLSLIFSSCKRYFLFGGIAFIILATVLSLNRENAEIIFSLGWLMILCTMAYLLPRQRRKG